jgi:hypothetical protein
MTDKITEAIMVRTLGTAFALSVGVLFLVSCDSAPPTAPSERAVPLPGAAAVGTPASHDHSHVTSVDNADVQRAIAQVRRLLAPFHNFDKAVEYGYSVAAPAPGVCISDPVRGGMGYHYTRADKDLIGDGVVNLLEPEFIVYSPQRNGGVRLSAVDYFVPYTTWPHSEPPSLLGVPFVAEDGFQAYVLHIWAFWPNPDGIFQNYNRDVPLCPE